jgi:hypothetical protein
VAKVSDIKKQSELLKMQTNILVDKLMMEKKDKKRLMLSDYINLAIDERNANAQKLSEDDAQNAYILKRN